jgi:hypothetical protein
MDEEPRMTMHRDRRATNVARLHGTTTGSELCSRDLALVERAVRAVVVRT